MFYGFVVSLGSWIFEDFDVGKHVVNLSEFTRFEKEHGLELIGEVEEFLTLPLHVEVRSY